MALASTERVPTQAGASSRVDRLLGAFPIVAIALGIVVFYAVEAWTHHTPWIFTDELEWTVISRSIEATAHTGDFGPWVHAKSLYPFFLAPFWAFHSTPTAYAALKYGNAVLMPLAAVPTYLLARMLVTKRAALAVAVLAVCIPAMSYATSIEPEVMAYPAFALASWLIVRGLTTGRRTDLVLAAVASVAVCLVRWPEFATVPAAFGLAAAGLWVTGPRGRALRSGWSWTDYVGAIVLLFGAGFLLNRVFLQHVHEWQVATQYYKNRMIDHGLAAGFAFAGGLGLLPVIGGFASLHVPERRGEPRYRAFAAYLAAAIVCVSLYTAVKTAYLSVTFSTLTEERNLIYLSPLLLIGTAIVFESKRVNWWIVGGTTAFLILIMYLKGFQLQFPYYEAPGMAIFAMANRWGWTVDDLRYVVLGVAALSLVLLAFRRRVEVAVLAVLLGGAWMLTSEIQSTKGFDRFADSFVAKLPKPLDRVDRDTGGQHVTYMGQFLNDPNGLLLTEFWNRSVTDVYSLDGTAPTYPPPGTPTFVNARGLLTHHPDDPYVLADFGVRFQAPVVDRFGAEELYRMDGPWRLSGMLQQVYGDHWCPDWCSYTYFGPARRGTLIVSIGRTGYNGDAPPGHVRMRVGSVRLDGDREPQLKHVLSTRWVTVTNGPGSEQVLRIPVRDAPVRVELRTPPAYLFQPDSRWVSAEVDFTFVPAKG